jgi:hypothetical protein
MSLPAACPYSSISRRTTYHGIPPPMRNASLDARNFFDRRSFISSGHLEKQRIGSENVQQVF